MSDHVHLGENYHPITLIQEGIATSLGLTPIDTVKFTVATLRIYENYRYRLWLQFPDGKTIESNIVEVPYMLHVDTRVKCKIGRDILKYGTLMYNGHANTFSFDLKVGR